MKGWPMIHKIHTLYDEGKGLSQSQIAQELKLSRNTVRKYLQMNESEIDEYLKNRTRMKELDQYRHLIVDLLRKYPKLSSTKIRRHLKKRGITVQIAGRTLRRYVRYLRQSHLEKAARYYEPVLDMAPGYQCQVDGGELRQVSIGGAPKTVYFLVFVLSYSRQMYVCASLKAYDTKHFIQAHDQAFRFFGGRVEECVYDQSKLVVIKEEFREVWFNESFYRYATLAGFTVRVCEGYDPESKGKVEAGVKYVKGDFFYGEEFDDFRTLQSDLDAWLKEVANVRIHGSTHKVPQAVFAQEEQVHLKNYLSPQSLYDQQNIMTRQVDKTSLISYRSNKYSVPMEYQQNTVVIEVVDHQIKIYDLYSREKLAHHQVCQRKGETIINPHHYRDHLERVKQLELEVKQVLGEELAQALCALIKSTSPHIYKAQLRGLVEVIHPYFLDGQDLQHPFEKLVQRSQLRVSFIKNYLNAFFTQQHNPIIPSKVDTQGNELLEQYALLTQQSVSKKKGAYGLS